MKKMTVRHPYFKRSLLLIVLSAFFLACQPKKHVAYKSVFEGYGVEGAHARALTIKSEMAFVGGKGGAVAFRYLNDRFDNNMTIEGAEDFRDIWYSSEKRVCLLMNSGDNGRIWRISPKGQANMVMDMPGVFLDGLAFWNDSTGLVYGDPVDGRFFLAETKNAGRTWDVLKSKQLPPALPDEAGFAASGTGIQAIGDSTVYFGTGVGATARLFQSFDRGQTWRALDTPLKSGGSYGIYSLYFWSQNEGIIMGGSYKDSTYNKGICRYTSDGGESWSVRGKGLPGYCSCIQGTPNGDLLVATGRMGTFYSVDFGKKWQVLTEKAYYTCRVTDKYIVLSGKNGALQFIEYILN